ncbi:MAG: thiol peroxidase [Paludibacteraceae bacterium]
MTTNFKGNPVNLSGKLPAVGVKAPDFTLVKGDLSEVKLSDFAGKKLIINIFPSIDTGVCAASVRNFNKVASEKGIAVLCVSKDLPFAQSRFCGAEGLNDVITASDFRYNNFAVDYGVLQADGPLQGLMARAVVALDENGVVTYTELVQEITTEPNYNVPA